MRTLKNKARDHVSGLARGLQAIEAFSFTQQRMSLADVAKRAGLTRAAARRYLLTLVDAGYADFDGKKFQLTPRVLRLGYAYVSSVSLPRLAQPVVDDLGERTEEAVALAVLDGLESLIVASSVSRRIVGIFTRPGTHLPVLSSSTGRVLIAEQSDEFISRAISVASPIQQLTPKTKILPDHIRLEIKKVRAQGFGLNDEEIELGLRVIAVPVRNSTGAIIAAICVSTHSRRFEIGQLEARFLPMLLEASETLRKMV